MGHLPNHYSARRKRLNHGKPLQAPHRITAPFAVQDYYIDRDFAGMLLISKSSDKPPKKKIKDKKNAKRADSGLLEEDDGTPSLEAVVSDGENAD